MVTYLDEDEARPCRVSSVEVIGSSLIMGYVEPRDGAKGNTAKAQANKN